MTTPDPEDIDWEALADDIESESAALPDPEPVKAMPAGSLYCDVCGVPIAWSGRGRKPRKCDEHKSRTTTRSTAPRTRRVTKHVERLASIEERLAKQAFKTGAMLSRFVPYTGVYLSHNGEKASKALCAIAADKPEWLDALETVADFEAYFELAEFVGGLIIAAGVDTGRVHPESVPARLLGVTEVHNLMEAEGIIEPEPEPEPVARQNGNFPQFGPGKLPEFTPIGDVG